MEQIYWHYIRGSQEPGNEKCSTSEPPYVVSALPYSEIFPYELPFFLKKEYLSNIGTLELQFPFGISIWNVLNLSSYWSFCFFKCRCCFNPIFFLCMVWLYLTCSQKVDTQTCTSSMGNLLDLWIWQCITDLLSQKPWGWGPGACLLWSWFTLKLESCDVSNPPVRVRCSA